MTQAMRPRIRHTCGYGRTVDDIAHDPRIQAPAPGLQQKRTPRALTGQGSPMPPPGLKGACSWSSVGDGALPVSLAQHAQRLGAWRAIGALDELPAIVEEDEGR